MANLPSGTFGDLLRQYRRAAGLTQEELAARARVSPRAISDLERGARNRPWRETIGLLATALALGPSERESLEVATRRGGRAAPPDVPRPSASSLESEATAPRHNLPVALTSFVGRERELAEVRRLLETTRLLTLTGTAGCGKTRLALRVSADLVDHYPDGVWMVELASLADPSLVPVAVAGAMGLREGANQPILTTLLAFTRARRLLLILDNCEHLVDACARLADAILRGSPFTHLLATSREALGIDGEVSWRVPSLTVPSPDSAIPFAVLAQNEAIRLFVDRAVAVQPAFALTKQNGPIVAQICGRLDGIPLAIELAARRVKTMPIEQIAARLDQRFGLLTSGNRAALPRQQTLAALVGWSYDLLSSEEKRLFNRLSVFTGGFTLEAAERVSEVASDTRSALDLLTSLVDKSLVVTEGEGGDVGRYRLLETLREFGWERLMASGDAAEAQQRHAENVLEIVEDCVWVYTSPGLEGQSWDAPLGSEQANLRAALAWYRENDPARGLRLAAGLSWFWVLRRDLAEGEGWLEIFLTGTPGETGIRGRALLGLATLKRDHGYIDAAQPLFEEALALCRRVGDRWGIARSLAMLAFQARSARDYDLAIALGEESLALARQIRVEESITWGLSALSQFYRLKGAYDRARELVEQVRVQSAGFRMGLNQLGLIAYDLGEYDRAAELFRRGLARGRQFGVWRNYVWWQVMLSRIARKQGDWDRARHLLEEDLTIAQQTAGYDRIPAILLDLAALEWSASNVAGGYARLAEGLGQAQRDGDRQCIAVGLLLGARRAFETEALVRSVRLFGAADSAVPRFRFEWDDFEMAEYEQTLTELRSTLAPDAFDAAWSEGQAMAVDEAIALALAGAGGP